MSEGPPAVQCRTCGPGEVMVVRGKAPVGLWDEHVVLAALFLLVGVVAFAFDTVAPVASRFDGADTSIALLSVACALVSLLLVPRAGRWLVLALVAVASVLGGALVAVRVTPQGQASAGYLLAFVALFAALYLTHRQMAAEVLLLCVLFAVASATGPGDLQPFYVGIRVLSILLMAEIVSRLMTRQRFLIDEIEGQASRDPLTGALNRRGAVVEAEQVRGVVERAGGTTTVNVIDLDGFKGFNDGHGHAAGDDLLVALVADWSATLRGGDVLARVGGDEFVVVLPQTDIESAAALLARMRAANPYPWTVGSTIWRPGEDLFTAAARADEALYAGKLRPQVREARPALDD